MCRSGFVCVLIFALQGAETGFPEQIRQISLAARGRVGMAATVLETGESVQLHGDQKFPMQSVYKFPIAMSVLHQVDGGVLGLQRKIRVEKDDLVRVGQHSPLRDQHPDGGVQVSVSELLRLAVSESDGSASDVLLRIVGGPARVASYLAEIGIRGVVVADTEKEIGKLVSVQYRNWASPDATVSLLSAFYRGRGLSAASRDLLLRLMTETPTGAHRIKGLLPAGTIVAHKTGTSGTRNGVTQATNDVGIVTLPDGRHMALAVFVSDAAAGEAAREGVIAKIARAAWDRWSVK